MEVVWRSYGIPMEHPASNAGATPEQHAIKALEPGPNHKTHSLLAKRGRRREEALTKDSALRIPHFAYTLRLDMRKLPRRLPCHRPRIRRLALVTEPVGNTDRPV